MRCRECGLELNESDRLRNGAYQCPECGSIHHTASSSRTSPSPWRRKRRSALPTQGNIFTRRLWLLPLWGWITVAAVALAAVLVLIFVVPGIRADRPGMPAAKDVPLPDAQNAPDDTAGEGAPLTDAEDALLAELEGQVETQPQIQAGRTSVAINDFLVSYEWAMSYLEYTSRLNLTSEESGASGTLIRNYSYENWLNIVITLDSDTSIIRSIVAVADEGNSEDDTARMTSAFVCMLYGVDNTLTASSASAEINSMMADNTYSLTRNGFTASLTHSEADGYTLQIVGKL